MNFKLLAVICVVAVASSEAGLTDLLDLVNPCKKITLSGKPATLGCIVASLCLNPSEERVKGFFDCYAQVGTGQDQFLGCMRGAFNNRVLDSAATAKDICRHIYKMVPYAMCLKPSFENAKVNGTEAVEKVNICQGKALGLGNGKV